MRLGVPILVPSIDRLSRNLGDLQLLDRDDLCIVTADHGHVSRAVLKASIARANAQSEKKSQGARKQHACRRASSGNVMPAEFDAGRKLGAQSNSLRSKKRTEEVCDYLRTNPEKQQLRPQELADHLNNVNLWNLKSIHGDREPWTTEALRPVRKAAMELLQWDAGQMPKGGPGGSLSVSDAVYSVSPGVGERKPEKGSIEELARTALPMNCAEARPLSENERALLDAILKEDISGGRTLSQETIGDLVRILNAPDTTLTTVVLARIEGFLTRRRDRLRNVGGSK